MTGGEHCVHISGLSSSNGFGFMVFWRFGGKGSLDQLVNVWSVLEQTRPHGVW